ADDRAQVRSQPECQRAHRPWLEHARQHRTLQHDGPSVAQRALRKIQRSARWNDADWSSLRGWNAIACSSCVRAADAVGETLNLKRDAANTIRSKRSTSRARD